MASWQNLTICASTSGVAGKPEARQPEGGFHDERVGLDPLGLLGGQPGAQLEVAGVKEAALALALDKALRAPRDVPGGVEGDPQVRADVGGGLMEIEAVFAAFLVGQPRVHEPGGDGREDNFLVHPDMVGVGVGNEGERLVVPRVEPQVVRGHVDPARVADGGGWEGGGGHGCKGE